MANMLFGLFRTMLKTCIWKELDKIMQEENKFRLADNVALDNHKRLERI